MNETDGGSGGVKDSILDYFKAASDIAAPFLKKGNKRNPAPAPAPKPFNWKPWAMGAAGLVVALVVLKLVLKK